MNAPFFRTTKLSGTIPGYTVSSTTSDAPRLICSPGYLSNLFSAHVSLRALYMPPSTAFVTGLNSPARWLTGNAAHFGGLGQKMAARPPGANPPGGGGCGGLGLENGPITSNRGGREAACRPPPPMVLFSTVPNSPEGL